MLHVYFAVDGSYGNAVDMIEVNTENWTEEDWEAIEQASDSERIEVARDLAKRK